MTWIDGPAATWDSRRGGQLVELLFQAYRSPAEIERVLTDSGAGIDYLPTGMSMRLSLYWMQIAHDLHADGKLRTVVTWVAGDRNRLRARLDELVADDPVPRTVDLPNRYEVKLLGPGRLPLIDRSELRSKLKKLIDREYQVMVVRGPRRCGKSYGFNLMTHVARDLEDAQLTLVDFSPVSSGNTAGALMSIMCNRLGVRDVTRGQTRRTTKTRFAAELVDLLVGAYREMIKNDRITRILVVDGLNRTDLEPDVYDLVTALVGEVLKGQLPRTQLVLTGYTGSFDRQTTYSILPEEVRAITSTDVRLYFQGLSEDLGKALTAAKLDSMVEDAMRGEADLEELGDRVRTLALDLIGAP